jgi:hypothetical protein
VSEPGSPPADGAFGAPPGAGQWPQPGPAVARAFPPPAGPVYGGPPAPGGYAAYAPTATVRFPVSAVVLLVVSVISLVATGIIGIPSAVVSVIAWRRHAQDPGSARRLTTRGWVVYAVNFAVGVPLLIWFYVWALDNQ